MAAAGYRFAATGATVTGTTFIDGDGVLNPDEAALGGVTVVLLSGDGTPLGSTVSGPDGSDGFGSLPLARCSLAPAAPGGYVPGTPAPLAVGGLGPVAGAFLRSIGFRPVAPSAPAPTAAGSIAGDPYIDADGSGARSAGDPPLAGVLVVLTGANPAGNAIARPTLTAPDGSNAFADLPAGTYSVRAAAVAGYSGAAAGAGGLGGVAGAGLVSSIPLGQGAAGTGYDLGKALAPAASRPTPPATSPPTPAPPPAASSISGTVYLDAARDGRFAPVDFGVARVSVVLTGTDTLGRAVRLTTATDGNGRCRFDGPAAGTYQLGVGAPAAFFRAGRAGRLAPRGPIDSYLPRLAALASSRGSNPRVANPTRTQHIRGAIRVHRHGVLWTRV